MERIDKILDRSAPSTELMPQSRPEPASATRERRYSVGGEHLTLMELLWKRMTEMYGHRWTSAMGAVPVDGWVIAVEGFSPEQIRGGLTKMVKDSQFTSWPPNALEFRALCLPGEADLGLPTAEEAFAQAVGNRPGQPKHPAVIHALRQIDSYALRLADEGTARKIWAEAWSSTVGQVAGGEIKSVRETSLIENLTDRSWAGKNNHKTA